MILVIDLTLIALRVIVIVIIIDKVNEIQAVYTGEKTFLNIEAINTFNKSISQGEYIKIL
jgi:hypothetical protein